MVKKSATCIRQLNLWQMSMTIWMTWNQTNWLFDQ